MTSVISATRLARQLGDVLGRIRYRRESFLVERNGVAVARLDPVEAGRPGKLADALLAWHDAAEAEPEFADTLERIGAADVAPGNPWE